ncbi:substrate-binding periplasmic protein [Dongshaea marina]|uniref:substrate-binding periplasmic protein n=1 Tax=Dongshaea marina TaxID=2047966 RepID=UPI000D3E71DE|nr:transporter substrate-binding domain-containing protein [Dongshaea marina]
MKWMLLLLGIYSHFCLAMKVEIANGEWPPWNSAKIDGGGLASQIVRQAFVREGVKVEYHFMSWDKGFEMARQGKLDATIGWIYSEKRAQDFYFSTPIFAANNYWFYRKDNSNTPFDWEALDKIKTLRLGMTKGYLYGEEFNELSRHSGVTVTELASDKEGFEKLNSGKIDLFPVNLCVGYFLIRTYFPAEFSSFSHAPTPISVFDHYLLFSKKSPNSRKLVEIFNSGMEKLKKSRFLHKVGRKCFSSWQMSND